MRVIRSACAVSLLIVTQLSLVHTAFGQAETAAKSEAQSEATPQLAPQAAPQSDAPQQAMSHGEYLARLGNCVACHSTPDSQPFAGGLKMAVPMIGIIYTTNITPDPETGIGNYSFEDFDAAMRHGVAKAGYNLYPAMPYPSYAKMSAEDMHAMYDYFMKEVQPVKQANRENETSGWLSGRWLMSIWKFFFLDDDSYEKVADQNDAWNRGAYLTQGLGHCGACHTPRGWLFQEKGSDGDDSDFLAGESLDHWSAPSLNGDINSGLGRWTEAEIVEFLKTGKNRYGTAFGTMVEVVNNSTQHMTDADLQAMATYLKTLPPQAEKRATPYAYDATTTTKLASFNFEQPGSQRYYEFCSSCHGFDGAGYGKTIPSLAGNPVVIDSRAESLINLTLNGSLRVVTQGHAETFDMPHFRGLMTDQEVADTVNFMRSAWGNAASKVKVEDVTAIRAATDPVANNDIVVLRMK